MAMTGPSEKSEGVAGMVGEVLWRQQERSQSALLRCSGVMRVAETPVLLFVTLVFARSVNR